MNSIPSIHYKSLAENEDSYWWHISRLNWTENIIRNFCNTDNKNYMVIDYGCGCGGFIHNLSKRLNFNHYLGVDLSPEAIKYASRHSGNFQLIKQDQFDIINEADLIFLMDVLEHIKNDKHFMYKLITNLKPKSYLLLSVPALPSLFSGWDKTLGHYRRYSKMDIRKLSEKCSSEILYNNYCFSYILPIAVLQRVLIKQHINKSNCEFPAVSKLTNLFLLLLNHLEISFSKRLTIPYGTSIFCLLRKK